MRYRKIIIAAVLYCLINNSMSLGNQEISKEDLEIIKNLELLEELEIVQGQDLNLVENYDEVSNFNSEEGENHENKTDQ